MAIRPLHRRRVLRLLLLPLLIVGVTFASALSASAHPQLSAHPTLRFAQVVSFSEPMQNPESIALDRRGDMYLSMPNLSQVFEITPDGTQSIFATFPAGMRPLGVRLDRAGNVFVAVVGSGVWRIPAGGGAAAEFAPIPGFPNGLAFDRHGNLYVSESVGGVIYRVTPHGAVSTWSASPLLVGTLGPGPCGLPHPSGLQLGANGLVFDQHGDNMFVSNTTLGEIIRIPVKRHGAAGKAVIEAGPDCQLWGADGAAMDQRGHLYVAANAERNIVRVDRNGKFKVIASFAGGAPLFSPSDIAFGTNRKDRDQIFITNLALFTGGVGAGVVATNVGVPGLPLP